MQPADVQSLLALLKPGGTTVYLASILAGLYIHYLFAKYNGRTAATGFWEYWLKETPGMSIATFIPLSVAVGAILQSGVLTTMTGYAIFMMGFGKAFAFDALIQAPTGNAPAAETPKQAGFARVGFLVLLMVVALYGCETLKDLVGGDTRILTSAPAQCVTVTKSADGKEIKTVNQLCYDAAEAIAQANVVLSAIDRTALSNLQAGIWTKAQAQPYYDATEKAGEKLDEASKIFLAGSFSQALTSANAQKQLLLALQKQVAAQARR